MFASLLSLLNYCEIQASLGLVATLTSIFVFKLPKRIMHSTSESTKNFYDKFPIFSNCFLFLLPSIVVLQRITQGPRSPVYYEKILPAFERIRQQSASRRNQKQKSELNNNNNSDNNNNKQFRDFFGNSIVITGVTQGGIGYENAKQFSSIGFRVVMVCRNQERAEKAMSAILEEDPEAELELVLGDISDLSSLKQVSQQIIEKATKPQIDPTDGSEGDNNRFCLLLNNAGIFSPSKKLILANGSSQQSSEASSSSQNLPSQQQSHDHLLQTNHLGVYLLTEFLVPHLEQGHKNNPVAESFSRTSPRIVNVSSIAHIWSTSFPSSWLGKAAAPDVNNTDDENSSQKQKSPFYSIQLLNQEKDPNFNCYAVSKLCNILHMKALSQRLVLRGNSNNNNKKERILCFSAHPGSVNSQIFNEVDTVVTMLNLGLNKFFKTPELGSQCSLHCCLSEDSEVVGSNNNNGESYYFTDCKKVKASPVACSEEEANAVDTWSRIAISRYF